MVMRVGGGGGGVGGDNKHYCKYNVGGDKEH